MNPEMEPLVWELYQSANKARLPVVCVSETLGISRATLYLWYAGGKPSAKYVGDIKKFIGISNFAVEKKLLPALAEDTPSKWKEAIMLYKGGQDV